jgi:ABC-type nitrate/sulfonate/bicarbonate transport system permease component
VAARAVNALKGLAGVAVAIGVWELLPVLGALPDQYAPGVGEIATALRDSLDDGTLSAAVEDTLTAWAIGMAITIGIAVPVGALLGLSRAADAALRVVVDFLRPVPAVALIPVAVLIFGIELKMQLALIVFACVWPLLLNVRYGVQSVDPLLLDTGRVSGLSRLALVRRVVLPSALPAIFTGVRIAATLALVLAISAGIVAGSPGLGKLIVDADQAANIPLSYAGVVMSGIFGVILNLALAGVDRLVLPWTVAARGETA